MNKTNYIITGGTGYIGRLVVERLIKEGGEVVLLVRGNNVNAETRVKNLFDFTNDEWERVHVFESDIKDISTLAQSNRFKEVTKRMGSVDVILHMAASLSFRSREKNLVHKTNIEGTKIMSHFAKDIGSTFFFMSTTYVHGRKRGILIEDDLEYTKFNNYYEQSKYEAEKYLQENNDKIPKYVVIRPSVVVGSKDSGNSHITFFGYYALVSSIYRLCNRIIFYVQSHRFLSKLFGLQFKNNILKVSYIPFVVTNTKMNLVSVHTVTEYTVKIIKKRNEIKSGTVFQIANPQPLSMKEISRAAFEGLGLDMKIIVVPRFLVVIFFAVLKSLSIIIKPLQDICKKWHYYKYYMTNSYEFDVTNVCTHFGKDEYYDSFNNQKENLIKAAQEIKAHST